MTLVTQYFDGMSADLMRMNFMVQEVADNIVRQTELLRMRDLGLPDVVVQQATSIKDTLQSFTDYLEDDYNELAQLRALAHTAALINSSLDLNEVLSRAMDTVVGLTDAERGYILLRNEDSGEMEFMIGRKIGIEAINADEFVISRSVVDRVIKSGVPVVTDNAAEDPRFNTQESIMSYQFRGILCVPLMAQEEVIGVVYADSNDMHNRFGDQELELLTAFANQGVIAIDNARLYERVRIRLAEVTENRKLLDSIFASIASGIITIDNQGFVQTYSPVAEKILGVSAQQSVGSNLSTVLPTPKGFEHLIKDVHDQDSQEIIELDTVLPNRGPTNLNLKLSPLKSENEATMGVAVVVDDLTELKQRDETINVVGTYLSPEMVSKIHDIDSLGLSGEERLISVLFCDVRGFTSFSEQLEPEEVLETINKYLTTSGNAIKSQDGIIDKYMGDAVVGLYNTQLNSQEEEHAIRAVHAALKMATDVKTLHKDLPENYHLWYGIGVHTDMAMLGNVGSPSRKEFTVLGNAITYAKKLQEMADKGELLISEETYQLVKAYFEVESSQRQPRDSDKLITVYKVLGEK